MVSLDTESQTLFTKGTEIEVTSDEEGFRGAWYRATILESPHKSTSKKRKKVLIEYKHLLTEDGSTPLAEYVDPAYIRPLPPQQEGGKDSLELNDVVEANYRDGWWTGTVRKVLENGKFRVCFDNPPDVLDFDAKELRPHYEWANGNWVRPEKQKSTGSIFSPGTTVEVNIDNKENLHDVWFPAIVIKENEDGTFYVKYQNSRNIDEAAAVKVTLDSKHIRPDPPCYLDRNYELLEKVDASYGLGWRAGVITKVLAGGRYNIFFKHGNEDKELSHSDIRPHVEWPGDWLSKSKEVLIAFDNQEQLGHARKGSDNPEVALELESSGSAKDNSEEQTSCLTSIRKNQIDQSTPSLEDSAGYALSPSKKKMKLANSNGSPVNSHPNEKLTERNTSDAPLQVIASHLRKIPNETTAESGDGLASPKTERTGTKISKKPVIVEKPAATVESPLLGKRIKIKQLKFGVDFETSDLVKKRGRPAKLQTKGSLALVLGKESNTTFAAAEELNENDSKKKEAEMPVIVGLKANLTKGTQVANTGLAADEVSLKLIRDQKKNLNDSGGDNSMPKSGGSGLRRKRGRPRKLVVTSLMAPEDGKEHKGAGGAVGEVVSKDHTTGETELPSVTRVESTTVHQGTSGDKTVEVAEVGCFTKEVDMAITAVSNNTVDDDQPLSTWIGGMHSSVEELRLSTVRNLNVLNEGRERQIGVVTESSVTDLKGGGDPVENQMLPFVKKSPIWKTIESMEVFQIVPQNPHFRPLAVTKEEYREGSAVGFMVTYAGLFEKISMLKLDDSRSIFDRTLESLLDLEKHGFDVTLLRGRVNELLSIRDGQEQLLDELKDAEREIMERTKARTKLDEGMVEIRKKISELQEQLDSRILRKQTEDYEIARLQSDVGSVNKRVQSARYDFEKLAGAPWKSS